MFKKKESSQTFTTLFDAYNKDKKPEITKEQKLKLAEELDDKVKAAGDYEKAELRAFWLWVNGKTSSQTNKLDITAFDSPEDYKAALRILTEGRK